MAQYIQLSPGDIQQIAKTYRLVVHQTAPVPGGASNTNLLLHTDAGAFVLTVFDNKTKVEVEIMGRLLQLLELHQFPTTRLLLTGDGRLTSVYKEKPIIIKSYITGQILDELDEAMLRQAGAAMAQLHSIPPPDFLPQVNSYGFQLFPQVIGQQIDEAYESWLAARYDYFRQQMPADLPRSIIHADLFTDNILFDNRQLKAMIDFEDGCCYFRAFDIGMGILGLCRQGQRVSLDKGRAFMRGYRQMQTLEEAEKRLIPFFVNYAATVTSYWRFWKYRVHKSIAENADKHWQMAGLADSVTAVPETKFIKHLFDKEQDP